MAFASVGGFITANNKVSGSATWVPTTTSANLTAGSLGILLIAKDNISTTDGNTTEVSTVTDAANNVWTKIREFTNGQGGAGAGATISLWYTIATGNLGNGANVTITFSTSTVAAKGCTGWVFSLGVNSTISIDGNATDLANDGADAGSMNITLATSKERIWIRACAVENTNTIAPFGTVTANFTEIPLGGTGGGNAITNMGAWGEFRIVTSLSQTSDPTTSAADQASVFICLSEVAAAAVIDHFLLLMGVGA